MSADLVTALLARSQLRRAPGGMVLYDLRSSRVTPEEIRAAGGVAEMCRVGHSFVKAQMRASGAIFAGELSGHFYFRFSETLVADDGTAALLALLDVLGRERRPLSELIAPLRRYAAERRDQPARRRPAGAAAAVESEHRAKARISHLDGLLVEYPDWWFNLRPVQHRAGAAAEPRGERPGRDGARARSAGRPHGAGDPRRVALRAGSAPGGLRLGDLGVDQLGELGE